MTDEQIFDKRASIVEIEREHFNKIFTWLRPCSSIHKIESLILLKKDEMSSWFKTDVIKKFKLFEANFYSMFYLT